MKRKMLLLGLAVLMLAGWIPGDQNQARAEADERPLETIADVPRAGKLVLLRSEEYRKQGEHEAAVEVLTDFVEGQPGQDHFLIRFYLAVNLEECGRTGDAIENYKRSVELEERHAQAWLNLGELAYGQGDYKLAGEAISQGFRHSKEKRAQVLYIAAGAYLNGKNYEAAAGLLEELVSGVHGKPRLDWYRALISATLEMEDVARGRTAVSDMLTRFPDDPEAWQLAFQFGVNSGDYQHAAVALTIKDYIEPLPREQKMLLGDIYAAMQIPAVASRYYESALADGGDPEDYEKLASAYLGAHQSDRALDTLTRALEKQPTARLYSLLGDLHYIERNYGASYEAFKHCSEMDSAYGRAFLMMGYCAMELGRIDDAIGHLERATTYPDQERTAAALLERAKTLSS
jgi:tetratricopeptide (TPR) repeat protein